MALRRIQVSDFRCLRSAEIEIDPRITLVSGPNASGKTSLLECIYVLGRGRSFRTRRLDHLIRTGAEQFVIYGEVELSERRTGMGVEGSARGMRAKMSGEQLSSLAPLASLLPVQTIDPEVHRLIEEGPSRRRRFLDWGVFHVEQGYLRRWQRYQQVLKQRNAALKAGQSRAVVAAWDPELVALGNDINMSRAAYVEQLVKAARAMVQRLLGMELALTYRRGWNREIGFDEALRGSWAHDHETGNTQVGPHRAELSLRLDGTAVRDRISRGQQKLLATALLMAQLRLFPLDAPAAPTLLLDDPAAELDSDRLLALIQEIHEQPMQLVVTSLSEDFKAFGAPGRRYAIDGGQVRGS